MTEGIEGGGELPFRVGYVVGDAGFEPATPAV